jgi:phage terminase large subunit-like protein
MARSLAEKVALLPPEERAEVFEGYTEEDHARLKYDADFWLRPEQQIEDGEWNIKALVAGRGFGKTLTASQWIRRMALEHKGCRIAIAGRTVADVRNVMVNGESGVLAVHPDHERPEYKQHVSTLFWPNGSQALLLSSEAPDSARGPQFHYAVGDEFAAWKTTVDSSGATLYSNLIAATRLGEHPRILLATTPKRTAVMKDLIERAKDPAERIDIITGSTFDNTSLSENYLYSLERQYGNSDLAKQELYGMMLEDTAGLLFTDQMIENNRIAASQVPRNLPIRFIAVDPSVAENPRDECGIIAMGATAERDLTRRTAYVLDDYSLCASPDIWARQVVDAARAHRTRYIVAERNQGGALIQMAINAVDPTLKVFTVVATKGKQRRAEPVVMTMQQQRVKLVDQMIDLEDQLLYFDPEETQMSPDRMDAMVWGVTAALISPPDGMRMGAYKATSAASRRLPSGLGTGRQRSHFRAGSGSFSGYTGGGFR